MPKLYVVATPIGNLEDLSPRARRVLEEVSAIAAEDTRTTRNLGVRTSCVSSHRHNEEHRCGEIISRMLEQDEDWAVVSDAGTPAISDPGSFLVDAAHEAGVEVLAVPGPCAMAAALSVSGFDTREFAFYGFLPRKDGDLKKRLREIAATGIGVAVLYESPHRVIHLMQAVCETLPGARASVSCDLTKKFEKTIRGTAEEVLAALQDNEKTEKGEYVIVVDLHGVTLAEEAEMPRLSPAAALLARMLETGEDARTASAALPLSRNDRYRAVLEVDRFLGKEEP